ncbi:hypothetical protein [Vibrio hangzhouensis]|uniref:Uncharacterized protein n=1 Tax=Vibrio hangzhouensis TaxID=462991 RepID=A0A1H5TB99_9VIBR|nr:hypothetical protein [Vibrio hangzhouensis]SEF59267.1 hypothetical protein SAMN04488244_102169 [Vibrio hangzhouensis]
MRSHQRVLNSVGVDGQVLIKLGVALCTLGSVGALIDYRQAVGSASAIFGLNYYAY